MAKADIDIAISLTDEQAAIDNRRRNSSLSQFSNKKKGRPIKKRQSTHNIHNIIYSPSTYPQSPPMGDYQSINRNDSYLGGGLIPPMPSKSLSRSTSLGGTRRMSKRRLDPVKERHNPNMKGKLGSDQGGFGGLDTTLSTIEIEVKRALYFNADHPIYPRLFPRCICDLCRNEDTLSPIRSRFGHSKDDIFDTTQKVSELVLSNNSSSNKPRPMLKAHSSLGLKHRKTPYKGVFSNDHPSNKLMVRKNSFNIRGRGALSINAMNLSSPSSFDKNGGAKSYGGTMDSYDYNIGGMNDDDDGSYGQLHLNCDCEREKTIPLVEVMAIGAKNNRIDLMHTINDINSRMIYHRKPFVERTLHFTNAKSLPIEMNATTTATIKENEETPIAKAATDTNLMTQSYSVNPPNSKRGLSRSGSISSRGSSSFAMDTPKMQNNISYDEQAPITNMKIPEFARIQRLHSALRQYHSRLAPPLDFNPEYIIKDDVDEIIDIIKITTHFIKPFVNRDGMPFQVDLMIIPRATEEVDPEVTILSDPESDGDDTDEDIDPFGKDDDDTQTDPDFDDTDYLGKDIDIGKLLKDGLHDHHHDHFEDGRIPFDRSDEGIDEHLEMMRKRKIHILKKSTQNGRYVMIVDRRKNKPKLKEFEMMIPKKYNEQAKKYEEQQNKNKGKAQENKSKSKSKTKTKTKTKGKKKSKKRFIPKYELTQDEQKKYEAMDDMYFFQPCKPYGDLIDYNTMIEILHLNTLQCLVPKPSKTKENEEETKSEDDEDDIEEYIGARDSCKGSMFVVSFHILSVDEIRCYLYVDGKYMRIKISNDSADGDDLETMLEKYIKFDVDAKSVITSRKKYRDFAFNTLDRQFDEDFKWTQWKAANNNRFTK